MTNIENTATSPEPRTFWAARRQRLGISVRELARRSGVASSYLSLMERGRGIPTTAEYDAIMAVLDAAEHGPKEAA